MRDLLLPAATAVTQTPGGKFPEVPKNYDMPGKLLDVQPARKSRKSGTA
ncbi:hypothetical protein CSIRO_1964 [Bradyrhizobiaceae bacterium SG-6C]|nr:hypothetical protein CSIRO_1964 [Bradyrhizobiaceae bacterium SG-6C]